MEELKKALEEFKKEVLDKAKLQQDATSEKLTALEKKLEDDVKKEIEAQITGRRKASLPGLQDEKEKFHLYKCVKAQMEGKWGADASFEKAVIDEVEKKSSNAGTGTAGGFLIPEEVTSEIIDLAIANMPIKELGPTMMRGLRGELPIPKVTGRQTAYWVGEEEAPTESNVTYGQIVLRPKTLAGLTKVSRQVIYQSSNVAEMIVREQLANAMQLALEEAAISGAGTDKTPKGILNYSGLTSTTDVATNGARFKVDKGAQMITNVDVANMLKPTGSFGFLMRPEVKSGMMRERVEQFSGQGSANGMPVINPFVTDAVLEQILRGYKIRTTTLLSGTQTQGTSSTCSTVIFGDWKQFIMAFWEGFELRASDSAGDSSGSAFTQRQIWLTAFQSVDMNIKDETGFTKAAGAEVNEANW